MKIFVGYASEHLETAREVTTFLQSAGHEVWFDKSSLIPGVDWDRERVGGQNSADLIIHLCSLEIIKRKGVVNREIRKTLQLVDDQPFGAIFVVFIRLQDFRLPVELSRFQYVDYFKSEWRLQLQRTLDIRTEQLSPTPIASPPIPTTRGDISPTLQMHEYNSKDDNISLAFNFPEYQRADRYYLYVNSAVANHVLEKYFSVRGDIYEIARDDQESAPDWKKEYSFEMTSEEFFKRDQYLSLRFYAYYDLGGAHPNHSISSLNFLGENFGLLTIEILLGHDAESANKLLTYCKKVIIASFENDDQEDIFEGYADNEADLWNILSQFNFDRRGITVNFSPYDILPYAFGSHEVHVPWAFLDPLVSDKYRILIDSVRQ